MQVAITENFRYQKEDFYPFDKDEANVKWELLGITSSVNLSKVHEMCW